MIRPSLVLATLLAVVALSGCAVADGVAHLVKLGQQAQSKTASAAPVGQPAPPPAAVIAEEPPAPPPAPRDSIGVEELAPPRH